MDGTSMQVGRAIGITAATGGVSLAGGFAAGMITGPGPNGLLERALGNIYTPVVMLGGVGALVVGSALIPSASARVTGTVAASIGAGILAGAGGVVAGNFSG